MKTGGKIFLAIVILLVLAGFIYMIYNLVKNGKDDNNNNVVLPPFNNTNNNGGGNTGNGGNTNNGGDNTNNNPPPPVIEIGSNVFALNNATTTHYKDDFSVIKTYRAGEFVGVVKSIEPGSPKYYHLGGSYKGGRIVLAAAVYFK